MMRVRVQERDQLKVREVECQIQIYWVLFGFRFCMQKTFTELKVEKHL